MALDIYTVSVPTIYSLHILYLKSKPEERKVQSINIKPRGFPAHKDMFIFQFNFLFYFQTTLCIHVLFISLISLLSNALTTVPFPLL